MLGQNQNLSNKTRAAMEAHNLSTLPDVRQLISALQDLKLEISALRQDLRKPAPGVSMKEFYSVHEAAQKFGRSPDTLRRWIRQGSLEAFKLNEGGRTDPYVIPAETVETFLRQNDTRQHTLTLRKEAGESLPASSEETSAGNAFSSPRSGGP